MEIKEYEVLLDKTDEDPILIATTSPALTQDSVHNISILNGKLTKVESKNKKLEKENINLEVEVNKKWKVDDHLNSLKENMLVSQEILHDAKTESFVEVHNMVDMLKSLEKNLEVASQIHQSMEYLQVEI